MSLGALVQPGRHALAKRKNDLYETPPEAVWALLKAEYVPTRVWEPACGRGAIVDVLRETKRHVVASDLINHGWTGTAPGYYGRDFLKETACPEGTQAIVTNPPFHLATQFAEHAITLCPKVILLLRLAFLEGIGRTELLEHSEHSRLTRVYVFRNRLPMMHRDGWDGPRTTSATAFAWFVWDAIKHPRNSRPTEIHRISWEKR